jgi:hypothetical protein
MPPPFTTVRDFGVEPKITQQVKNHASSILAIRCSTASPTSPSQCESCTRCKGVTDAAPRYSDIVYMRTHIEAYHGTRNAAPAPWLPLRTKQTAHME